MITKESLTLLKKFFVNYLWLGVALLLLSIILDTKYPTTERTYYFTIIIKLIESIGIAILISAIFTFAAGTSEFIEKIKGLLENIVVKRNFLSNINPEGKREALKSLIEPSLTEKNSYPNIGDYYGFFINKTLDIKNKSVRSNYQINSRVFIDKEKNKIASEGIYSYRLYPNSDGFNDIIIGFEDKESFCSHVSISIPTGDRKSFKELELKETDEGGDISYKATIQVKEFASKSNHIDVELNVTEYGTDHWKLIQFKALQPTDGFKFHLRCEDTLEVRKHAIFVVGAKYYLDQSPDNKSITISCNQWVNEGTGLCVLVSIPHDIDSNKQILS